MEKRNTKALVTLTVGNPAYKSGWENVFANSWRVYGKKYGYDVLALDELLDPSDFGTSRSLNWQKLLILENDLVRQYEDVVWLDADILINFHNAPCVVSENAPDKVGLVPSSSFEVFFGPQAAQRQEMALPFNGIMSTPEIYAKAGLDSSVTEWANTGVVVLKPARDRDLLRKIYDTGVENRFSAKEEGPLCNTLYAHDLAHDLDPRFNWPWIKQIAQFYPFLFEEQNMADPKLVGYCVNAAWSNAWFSHFTGDVPRKAATLVQQHVTDMDAAKAFTQWLAAQASRP